MKRYIVMAILLIVTVLNGAEVLDRIIAKVGSEIILYSELQSHKTQLQQMGQLPEDADEHDILNDMIESKLILQNAKDKNYEADEFRIRQIVNSQIDSQITRFGSEAELRNQLRQAGMTLTQLRDFYEQMLKDQRLKEMIIQNEIRSKVNVSDIDIEEYYYDNFDELPLRPEMVEIGLIRVDIKAGDATLKTVRQEINRIYDRIREGKDFATLAGEYSDCPSSRNGGDLGFFGKGTMIKEFENAAFALKPGEISGIIETMFGYHIIKMEEKDEEDIRVRHILKMIKPTEEDIAATLAKVQEIHQKLSTAEDFHPQDFYDTAAEHSDDPTGEEGGVVGEFAEEQYPEMFKTYLNRIGIGEVTEIIRQENSLFILGKLRTIPERPFQLDEVRDELKEYLLMTKQVEQYAKWIQDLIADSYVEVLLY